jgi:ribosomal protein S18 acetylase RimI-like enzyme
MVDHTREELLETLEAYYDAVPRTAARVEEHPPFVLFVRQGEGWPYYARPQRGAAAFTAADVLRVRARQRALAIPEAFEWVAETTPALRAAALAGGLRVADHPLMVLRNDPPAPLPPPAGVSLRLAGAGDDFAVLVAVSHVGFASPGTGRAEVAQDEVARAVAEGGPGLGVTLRDRVASGATVTAVAEVDGFPVAVGSHQPVGVVSEIVGVATLPAFRRRGIAAALTSFLVHDVLERDVRVVFLSAGDEQVARVYARAGFRHIGTACVAEPAADGAPPLS